jgi:hypothetical protein
LTLENHLDLINGSVVLEIEDESGATLYRGYKECFEYDGNAQELSNREVIKFVVRTEARKRNTDKTLEVINELNSGKFNYCDMYIELVYAYTIKNK